MRRATVNTYTHKIAQTAMYAAAKLFKFFIVVSH
jgi:hypothetical protein